MARFLEVEMPDGSKWRVPAEVIAKDRATYYETKEPGCYQSEFNYTLNVAYELKDWASNNMNWSDVKAVAVKVSEKTLTDDDFEKGWGSGESRVVEE